MFCPKCGKPTEEGQTLCPECLAAEAPAQEIPVQQAPAQEAPAQEAFELNLTGEEAPKAKKAKKEKKPGKKLFGKIPLGGAIAIGASIVLVITLVLGFWLGGWADVIGEWFNWLKKPAEHKDNVEEKSLTSEESTSDVAVLKRGTTKVYGAFVEALRSGDTATAMSLRVELGDELGNLIASAAGMSGDSEEAAAVAEILKAFKKAELNLNTCGSGELAQDDVGLMVNGYDLAGIRVIMDALNGRIYMGITKPVALQGDYIYVDVDINEAMAQAGATMSPAEVQAALSAAADRLPSEEEFAAMLDAFIMTAIREIDDVERERETLEADGIKQSFTVLTYKIDQSTAADMMVAIMEEAADNDTFRDVLEAVSLLSEGLGGDPIPVDDFLSQLEAMADSYEGVETDDDAGEIVIKTYVDAKGFVQGRSIILDEIVGEEAEITYLTATKGSKQGFCLEVKGEEGTLMELKGTATVKKGLSTGSYKLKVQGQEGLILETKNFDFNNFTGTLRIKLGKAIVESIEASAPVSAFIDLSGAALDLTLGEGSLDVGLYLNNKLLFSVGMTVKAGTESTVTIPDNAISAEDQIAMLQWVEKFNDEELIRSELKKAGLDKILDLLLNANMEVGRPNMEITTSGDASDYKYGTGIIIPGTAAQVGTVTAHPDGTYTIEYSDGTSVTKPSPGITTLDPDEVISYEDILAAAGSSSYEGSVGSVIISPAAPSEESSEVITHDELLAQAEKSN